MDPAVSLRGRGSVQRAGAAPAVVDAGVRAAGVPAAGVRAAGVRAAGVCTAAVCTAAVLAAAVLAAGCLGDRCGPDQRRVDTTCVLVQADASTPSDAAAGDAENAGDAGDSDGAGGADAPSAPLGSTCAVQEDCVGETNICIIVPGDPTGYCSIRDCTLSPDNCPAGYACVDLSAFVPELIACLKQ